ncbi:MAG TPA: hypothetical protein VIE88_07900, partial [Vicinamibacteria bacterium]
MRSLLERLACFSAALIVATLVSGAEKAQGGSDSSEPSNDPRVGLKAGFRDAGEALYNLELVKSLPKPEGFYDPNAPGGEPMPPEKEPGDEKKAEKKKEKEEEKLSPAEEAKRSSFLAFANSDLAFSHDRLFVGNFHGFNTYNIEDPRKPRLRVSVPCPGGQGDLSVYRHLMFMSVEQTR